MVVRQLEWPCLLCTVCDVERGVGVGVSGADTDPSRKSAPDAAGSSSSASPNEQYLLYVQV